LKVVGAALIGATVLATGAMAQTVVGERVAAVVNDHPISTFDVRQRMRLMMITQGVEVPPEAMEQFQNQALRDLVDERLKLQEAERYELTIPEEQIDEELARIAASGGASVQDLVRDLASQGIDVTTLRDKIRAEEAWTQLVRGRYGARVNVTTDEVEDMMSRLKEGAQEEQFLVSEICLPLEGQSNRDEMYNIGLQMIDQMRQGAPFRALAQQFSACPSAARGGDLGWLRASDLDDDLSTIVTQLDEGNISRPVPHEGMLKLLAVRQKRQAAAAGEPSYQVAYAGAPSSIGRERAESAFERLPLANPCNGEALSVDLGPQVGVTVLPMLPEREFETTFHDVLSDLEEGRTSEIIESEGAYHVVMMCEKDEGFGLPSRRVVENQLEAEELELLSRRYLRDVERDSSIEIRLTSSDS
jgi:peptidyl-prolyl cis-trans isomerase SurA